MSEITIIVTAHDRGDGYKLLDVLVASFMAQTFEDWRMLIVHDGPSAEYDKFVERRGYRDKIRCLASREAYQDWGHSLRAWGLYKVETPWVMWANDDNYYTPVFLERMLAAGNEYKANLVMCNMVHNDRNYGMIDTRLVRGHVDIGSFIVKTDVAQQTGFNHRDYAADWHFLDDFVTQHQPRVVKVNQVLYVHN